MPSKIRRAKECRKDLQRWINLVNSVPASFKLDQLVDDSLPEELCVPKKFIEKPPDLIERFFAHFYSKLPFKSAPGFYRNLKSDLARRSGAFLWWRIPAMVTEIEEARTWLRMIARRGKAAAAYSAETGVDISKAFSDWYVWLNPNTEENQVLQREYFLEPIYKGGELSVDLPEFISATIGVDALRIKECPICGNIFWAGRREKSACTGVCTNRWGVRQNYARQKENRERRKKLKAKKAVKQ